MAQTIIGIDPSLTNTAVIRGDARDYQIATFGSTFEGDRVVERVERYDGLVAGIMDWIGSEPVDAIYIEAYSYGSNDARAKFSAEYGGILRWHLAELTDRIFEVAPMTLKKFCTGAGKGGKELVCAHLSRRWHVMFGSNDEFDAFGLFRLGLVAEGLYEATNQAEREAADKALGVKRPKAKKRRAATAPEVTQLF